MGGNRIVKMCCSLHDKDEPWTTAVWVLVGVCVVLQGVAGSLKMALSPSSPWDASPRSRSPVA